MGPSATNSWPSDPLIRAEIQQSAQGEEPCLLKALHQWSLKERDHWDHQNSNGRGNIVQAKQLHLQSQLLPPLLDKHSQSTYRGDQQQNKNLMPRTTIQNAGIKATSSGIKLPPITEQSQQPTKQWHQQIKSHFRLIWQRDTPPRAIDMNFQI